MKLWIDDVRPAPSGYEREWSVNGAIRAIEEHEKRCAEIEERIQFAYEDGRDEYAKGLELEYHMYYKHIEVIDIDHDAGDYAYDGGDYINLLDWLEETGRNYPIHIHSMNPVGVANMRQIIQRNGWTEVK